MRIKINIDEDLMSEALKTSPSKTEKDVIEEGLRLLLQRKKQEDIRHLRGKLHWKKTGG